MAVEFEALRFRGGREPVQVRVEVGDALLGIEFHRLFKVAHLSVFIVGLAAKDKRGLRGLATLPRPAL